MKHFKCFCCILLVALMLSACSFRVSSSIDDLISPISPFGDNADIKKAMDEYANNGYSLKTPSSGKHISSYNFYDIDSDGSDEAIAFYEPSDNLGSIDMAIIKKLDDNWQVAENIVGEGKDIYSLDFDDVSGDSKKEIIVCWDIISNSTNHELCVYSLKNEKSSLKLSRIGESITVNNYIPVDMNNNGVDELLVFKISSGNSSSAGAELCSFKNNRVSVLGETKLDSHISSYSQLKIEKAENDIRVYADAIGSNGSSMLTELIYWSDSYGTIISPFYSYSSGRTRDTSRNSLISSMDINSDNLIEIPTDKSIKGLPKSISCVDWKIYKNTTLIHTDYSLFSKKDSYSIIVPDKYINKIKVSYDEKSKLMTVSNKETKNEVFSVIPVLKATYSKDDYNGYSKILDASGYYYLAKTGNDDDIKITLDNLKSYIKSI